jgi:phospholipid-binding lipoprotein MlaA
LQQAALDKYSFVRDAYTQQRLARLRGTTNANPPLPNYEDHDDHGDHGDTGPTAPPAGAPAGGLPNYTDPGESAPAPDGASGGAQNAPSGDLPNYTDPGDSSAGATPAAPTVPASAPQ